MTCALNIKNAIQLDSLSTQLQIQSNMLFVKAYWVLTVKCTKVRPFRSKSAE